MKPQTVKTERRGPQALRAVVDECILAILALAGVPVDPFDPCL
jgi:hypothetical protein